MQCDSGSGAPGRRSSSLTNINLIAEHNFTDTSTRVVNWHTDLEIDKLRLLKVCFG